MKFTPLFRWFSVTAIALSAEIIPLSLQAATFFQQEVNQRDFIAIARPYGDNKYDLLILQQLPGQRQCWQEEGGTPIMVNPLLLNFDFTDICERSTDSNGYSLRIDGQDLGLDYLLRVIERNGELVLVGTNRRDPSMPEVVVGRTRGLQRGFMKIQLDSGWRFTKRTYGNRVLSHVYLTGDRSLMVAPAARSTPPEIRPEITTPTPSNISNTPNSTPSSTMLNPPAIESPQPPLKEFTFTAPNSTPASPNSPTPRNIQSQPQSRNFYPVNPAPLATSTLVANSPLTTPVPPPLSANQTRFSTTLTANNGNLLPPPPLTPKPVPTSGWGMPNSAVAPSNEMPSPSTLPSSPGIFPTRTAPLSPTLSTVPSSLGQSGQSYRVLAAANNPMQLEQARSLYPEAFHTTYQGRRVLQIGRFSSRENAQQAYQSLQSAGLQAIIVP
jgi:hypothetical protein